MEKKIIAVIGATGVQGKGVINGLLKNDNFIVRAVTRNPEKYSGKAHEAVFGDLTQEGTLETAFKDAYGVFAVTNFWEPGGADEMAQGTNAIHAAKKAGVEHFIWSTLPNAEVISGGKIDVPHFTGKAEVDELVTNAGFKYHTFVQPPFYYQNLNGMLSPQDLGNGKKGWALPLNPTKKVIHMADINDLGLVVAGALLNPEKAGNGEYLSVAAELNSFNDVLSAFKSNGHDYDFAHAQEEEFSKIFEGAYEIAQTFKYFEAHTYMGADAAGQISLAKEISGGHFNSLNSWIKETIQA
ncbi:MAG: hypothetical protein ACI8TA_002079 [Cyclobacteriaceae bacterium]|jgi:uncharacterized protein YbjT (DUF2867 family)